MLTTFNAAVLAVIFSTEALVNLNLISVAGDPETLVVFRLLGVGL